VEKVLVVAREPQKKLHPVTMKPGRDVWYHEAAVGRSRNCEVAKQEAEDLLFILYTSGSTGKPKGIMHTTGGYMVYAYLTSKYIFDLRPEDVYWCTADVGWVTGHSYIVYGPLQNAATGDDVRGRAELAGERPVVADDRKIRGDDFFTRHRRRSGRA